jgi:hypothetical protein
MNSKDERRRTTVSMSIDEDAIFHAECKRTNETFSGVLVRLAMLGLRHEAQVKADAAVGKVTLDRATPREETRSLSTADPAATPSTDIVAAPTAAMTISTPTPVLRPRDEPTVTGVPASYRHRSSPARWWLRTTADEAPVGSDKRRWTAVGVLSTMLALMLVPGNGTAAAAISLTALGEPGDGVAASNLLFERYSNRAGPLRHWEATTRLADNSARVKTCANRADRFADYRQLTRCEIFVSSRKRAIEVGQGIVD